MAGIDFEDEEFKISVSIRLALHSLDLVVSGALPPVNVPLVKLEV